MGGITMKVSDFLMKLIFWAEMLQKDVAEKCNITPAILNEIIEGKRGISIKTAKAFEALFGVPTMIWLMWDNIDKLNEE